MNIIKADTWYNDHMLFEIIEEADGFDLASEFLDCLSDVPAYADDAKDLYIARVNEFLEQYNYNVRAVDMSELEDTEQFAWQFKIVN